MDAERRRRARRWVWGCTGGCLGCVLLVALAAFALVVRYFLAPVPVVPPQTFLTQRASAFLVARVDPAVPLTMQTARAVVGLFGRSRGPVLNSRTIRAGLSIFRPLQCVMVVESGAHNAATHGGLAVSVNRGGRLLRYLTELEVAQTAEPSAQFKAYGGAQMATLAGDAYLALRRNNLMLADNEALVKSWVGALKAERKREAEAAASPPAPHISPALKAVYDRLDLSLPLVFASLNTRHELASLADLAADSQTRDLLERSGILAEDIVSLSGQIKPLDANAGELTLFIDCPSPEAAMALIVRIAEVQKEAGLRWPLRRMSARSKGTLVTVRGRIEDLPAKAAGIVRALVQSMSEAPRERHEPQRATEGPTITT